MRPPTKNIIEVSDLEGYTHTQILLSGHNRANKSLYLDTAIDDEGEIYTTLILHHNYIPIDTPQNLPDAITKYNELI
jgi:hypothetical protein